MVIFSKPQHLAISEVKVVSFDVFDTVVTRITADPVGIFYKLQEQLSFRFPALPTQLHKNFAEVRVAAERTARRKRKREDITFADIYHEFGKQFNLSDQILEELMKLEIEVELESIRAVPANSLRVHDFRKEGKKIIFISDMYLPMPVIRKVLEKVGIFNENDEIYVSSEYGLTKSTGNLYLGVIAQENCFPRQLLHIGDNRRSDYLLARKIGKVSAYHYSEGKFTRFERILRKSSGKGTELSWQLIAGASRIARLQSHEQTDVFRKALYEVGANVAGPILWGFVSWVLKQAFDRKIQRLYFVARDGQILYDIAIRLREVAGYEIELIYLYGSRQAWHLPALTSLTDLEFQWITVKDPFLTLRLVASRLCLDPELMALCLRETGFPMVDLDQDLSALQVEALKQALLTSEKLQSLIYTQAEQKLQGVTAYLRQEGMFDETRWALVDSGWNGRLQNSLCSILKKSGWDGKVFGFYFGLLSAIDPPWSKEAYFFSPSAPVGYRKWGPPTLNLLELMMSADHGLTLSYVNDLNDVWKPVLAVCEHDLMGAMGLTALREGVEAFLEHLDLSSIQLDHDLFREKILQLVTEFYLSPPRDAAVALGRMPFSTDQTEREFLPFAPALSLRDACRYAVTMSRRDRFELTFWIHGSRVQSSFLANALLSVVGLLHRFVGSIYEIFRLCRKQKSVTPSNPQLRNKGAC